MRHRITFWLTGALLPEQDEAADERAGGFSANGGITTTRRLLRVERASFNGPGLFDEAVDALQPMPSAQH